MQQTHKIIEIPVNDLSNSYQIESMLNSWLGYKAVANWYFGAYMYILMVYEEEKLKL